MDSRDPSLSDQPSLFRDYVNFLRMEDRQFDELLSKVEPLSLIQKQSTVV